MIRRSLVGSTFAALALIALGAGTPACSHTPPPAPPPHVDRSRAVFEAVAPSVVAILNDDRADREEEVKELLKSLGDEAKAPKRVIDVSLRKEPTPHGTGFMVEGGNIVTAAHVVMRPDRLKITTRSGQTVDAELVRLDEFRDVAVLHPKEPLKDVPPVQLEEGDINVGEPVWAMGHTGAGLWALSWGISEGVASGVVDLLGVKTLVFDAAVYPGFSGGPVIKRDAHGVPKVIGVNHAILFTGGFMPVASISSAVSISELRETVAGHTHPFEAKLAEYAKTQHAKQYGDLFITQNLSVHRDEHGQPLAEIYGNLKAIEGTKDGAYIPVAGMLFNLPKGQSEVSFELHDPNGQVVSTATKTVTVGEKQRVSFASAGFRFEPKMHGRYEVVAKTGSTSLGSATVALSLADEDDELVDTHDGDVSEDGDPDVDIVVAQFGNDPPLSLGGITSAWAEKSYPRRVGFTWFARGTRGWSGTNVAISAYVLDEEGHVVGHSIGCFRPELRAERPWSCMGTGGTPLTMKEGVYDVVFAINDKPVALWPMEAAIRAEQAPGSDVERWLKELARRKAMQARKKPEAPTPPPTPPVDPKAKKPAPPPPKKK
jgi:S1-C subfamily serine protease